jgi:phosphohistidine phosphatase
VKRLYLFRHAKSSWDDATLADHERPLAPRGRKAAKRLARWLVENEVRPELVLCSTATRARETLEWIEPGLGSPAVSFEDALYGAAAESLLARLRDVSDEIADVLLVGHNPGLADLCLLLARAGPDRARVEANLPTGALAVLEAEVGRWSELEPGCAQLTKLVLAREL